MNSILINAEMTKAILDGRKTQTLRVIKPDFIMHKDSEYKYSIRDKRMRWNDFKTIEDFIKFSSKYKKGDIIWVREPVKIIYATIDKSVNYNMWTFKYKADNRKETGKIPERLKKEDFPDWIYENKYVPNGCTVEMARIFLNIINIRVERLQDISVEDIIKEGITVNTQSLEKYCKSDEESYYLEFEELWNKTAPKGYKWDDNPFVFIYEFKKILEDKKDKQKTKVKTVEELIKDFKKKKVDEMINKIHLGDSLEIMKNIPDKSIDLIVTDPPYIINGDTNSKTTEWKGIKSLNKIKSGLNDIADGFDINIYFLEWERVLKKFNAFVFCSNHQITELMKKGKSLGLYTTLLVWHKTNTVPFANGTFRSDLEFCIHFREKGATFNGNAKEKSKIYISTTEVSKYGHPTEKPLKLIKKYIKIGSNKDDIILDPFIGSGTTANACINLNRNFIGIEINKKYYDITCDRVERAHGNVGLFK